MRILFVHGIAQGGKRPRDLETIWVETLQEGFDLAGQSWPRDVEIDFPYYGDALDALVARDGLPGPGYVAAKGPGSNSAFEEFMQSALDEMQRRRIPESEVRANLDPALSQEKGIQNWGWVHAIARAIDRRLTPVTDFTIERFLREVYVYVARREAMRQINGIIEAKLTAEPTVVVGHSLGSVVAYNVLRAAQQPLDIRGFVTVGSPLGLTAISSKLGVLVNPVARAGWYNAYDKRDIVALNPLDDEYFPVAPAIDNSGGVDNSADNRHGIIGYLNDKGVAEHVARALS